jgi:uncharacterized protein YndB with AHSA1/START domain
MDNFMKPKGNMPGMFHAGGNPHFDERYPTKNTPKMPQEMLGITHHYLGEPEKSLLTIVNKRVFAASRERVFEAFSDHTQLVQWWAPAEYTNTIHTFDLKVGGRWHFTTQGPDGRKHEIEKEFLTVVGPEKIVLSQLGNLPRARTTMTMTFEKFEERLDSTTLTWEMILEAPRDNDRFPEMLHAILSQIHEQTFDRLETHLKACPAEEF